jgi:hypothetical protein
MVYSTLDGYGYDVMMSHKGTIPLDSKLSNLENCLKGVEGCNDIRNKSINFANETRYGETKRNKK